MKKLLFILLSVFMLTSCTEEDLTLIDTEVVEGKISFMKNTHSARGGGILYSTIYVQTPQKTTTVNVNPKFASKFKVGDDFIVVIKKYKENNQNK